MSDLYDSNAYLREAESLLKFGTFNWVHGQNEITWSEGIYQIFRFPPGNRPPVTLAWVLGQISENYRDLLLSTIKQAVDEKTSFEIKYSGLDYEGNELIMVSRGRVLFDSEDQSIQIVGITADVTATSRFQNEIEAKMEALDRSNASLEQFAYTASHDLQEPLRKITSFGERISTRYSQNLGEEGLHYLSRMLVATQRMKLLIESLLSYSRVSRPEEPFTPVNLNEVVKNVLSDFELRLAETKAQVKVGNLPIVSALPTQMHQLFQNLISNALKFISPDRPPVINISSKPLVKQEIGEYRLPVGQHFHKILIEDNGIGFEQAYSEQIFTLFRRLHGRSEYEGAGMGLAICKRIMEVHGGLINVSSQPGQGTTFILLIPEQNKLVSGKS